MLRQMSSRQIADWMAFARLEQVGEPLVKTQEDVEEEKRKKQRASFESGMKKLMSK